MAWPLLRLLWAAPASLVGLALAPFFDSWRIEQGLLVCEGARWPRRIGWRYRAITLGHVVLALERLDEPTLAHERAHARQYERWGLLMFVAYPLASLWARLRGRHHYTDNPFEVAARRDAP